MRRLTCTVAAIIAFGCPPARAQDAGGAAAFIRQLYAHYVADPNFSPFADLATVRTIATPGLARLVQRNRDATGHREAGLDADQVCGCQDAEGLRLAGVAVTAGTAGQATATATLQVGSDRVVRRFLLRLVGAEWRIDDITNASGRDGVRAALTQSIAVVQRHRH